MTDALITDDLTRQVHVVPQRLTKACPTCGGLTRRFVHAACGGSGRVPVEVGDTLELTCECVGRPPLDVMVPGWRCPKCDEKLTHSTSVLWEGPAAKVDRAMEPTGSSWGWCHHRFENVPPGADPTPYSTRILMDPDLYDALGIGEDPDQWVYLVEEAS